MGYSGTGTFVQSGGNNSTFSGVYLGYNSASSGTYTISNSGWLYTPGIIAVGNSGTGILNQYGGSVITPDLSLGNNAGSTGTYNLSDGTLTSQTGQGYPYGGQVIGNGGTGVFNQSGGTNAFSSTAPSGSLYVGYSGTGTYNQSGGATTISSGTLYLGYSSSGRGT